MAGGYTQTNRFLSLSTVQGENVLLVRSFSGIESLSRPFQFELDLLSENDSLDLEALIGTNATLRIQLADDKPRFWNGYISRLTQGWRGPVFTTYRAEFVPWLWFLGLNRSSRIFQDKTTSDIVRKVFTDLGFKDFDFRLEGETPKREYCVQYRETDLSFVMRLLEEEGIFFFFRHENGRHELVLGNSPAAHPVCPGQASAKCRVSKGGRIDEDFVSSWHHSAEFLPSRSALADFNFKTPTKSLQVKRDGKNPFEAYDQPGLYAEKDRGEALNRIRSEEIQAGAVISRGESTCRAFTAGHRFQLKEHYRKAWNQWYTLMEVRHQASQAGSFQGDEEGGSGGEPGYRNEFVCLPFKTPYRPVRRTPVPVVEGCQTAMVVGPQGEEIYTDDLGRVKVQFHWDREGKRNQESSCWIRVSQSGAGNRWGFFRLPRVGEEVVVDFLEGNPDRPLIVGSVYNASQMPPYPLPADKTKTVMKTNSSKGGDGFNEIRLEDQKGQEQVFIHAERNFDLRVKNDRMENVDGSSSFTVEKDVKEAIKGTKHQSISGDRNEKVDGTASLTAGADLQQKIGSNFALQAGSEVHIKSGMNLVLETGASLTLKVGSNFININPAGVIIKGNLVMINSGGSAGSGAGARPNLPELPIAADKALPGKPMAYGPQAMALKHAADTGAAFCDI